jgi:hypothetical protein
LEVSRALADGFGQSGGIMSEQEWEFIIGAAVVMSQIRMVDTAGL